MYIFMKQAPSSLPDSPGIYLFKTKDDVIIYIGKAKSIKKRVSSYFRASKIDWKIDALIQEFDHIDYILTQSEIEALLLEAELVQKHKPKFNALLKEGTPFLYIVFIKKNESDFKKTFPGISIARLKPKKGIFFGPFIHKTSARSMARFLEDTFQLYRCNKKIADGCLQYHLGRCAGTCRPDFDDQDYEFRLDLARDALAQNKEQFLNQIIDKMKEYSHNREYEKAQRLKKYIDQTDIIFTTIESTFSQKKYAAPILFTTLPNTHKNQEIAFELQEVIGTDQPIHSIDCFDISHFYGKDIVGSCIRFVDGIPDKNSFRRFKVKSLSDQNDYAALQEIVQRRYRDPYDFPELILIDGGKGQLNAALAVFPNAPIASLAKREERLFFAKEPEGIILDPHTSFGKTLLELRDYTHHFAISYHRLTRKKSLLTS
jgi:excinuclease ABC subunit C